MAESHGANVTLRRLGSGSAATWSEVGSLGVFLLLTALVVSVSSDSSSMKGVGRVAPPLRRTPVGKATGSLGSATPCSCDTAVGEAGLGSGAFSGPASLHGCSLTWVLSARGDGAGWLQVDSRFRPPELPSGDPDNPVGARVFCLTCHRAHASPYPDAMRWDYGNGAGGCLECHTFNR